MKKCSREIDCINMQQLVHIKEERVLKTHHDGNYSVNATRT